MANSPLPERSELLAYVVGLALGDGNLSRLPRTTRLRISCDARYPALALHIIQALQELLPENRVSLVPRATNYFDVSCCSNHWESLLGWSAGSKVRQGARVSPWIKKSRRFAIACLRGLIETDGAIYCDRGYWMVGFYSVIPDLASDVREMIEMLGFRPRLYKIVREPRPIYRLRLARDVDRFLALVNPIKS